MESNNKKKSKSIFWVEDAIVDKGYLKSLKNNKLNVLWVITRHYNKHGHCYPSLRTISKFTGLHHSTVKKKIVELDELGFVKVTIIKEGYKARYSFTKTALEYFIDPTIPRARLATKEGCKNEVFKYSGKNDNLKGLDPDGDPVYLINGKLRVRRKNGEFYDYNGNVKDLTNTKS